MSRVRVGQAASRSLFQSPRAATRQSLQNQFSRCLSQTASRRADESNPAPDGKTIPARKKATESLLENIYGSAQPTPAPSNAMSNLSQSFVFQNFNKSSIDTSSLSSGFRSEPPQKHREDDEEPFHFHIYAHKHNTHITVTKPSREPIISMSCGNIGFKKSRRGLFDSGYSLTKYVLERLFHTGWPLKINRLELVLRGFGKGRDAAVKVLMSPEGKIMRDKIIRVSDSTRVKFAGTRSRAKRRV